MSKFLTIWSCILLASLAHASDQTCGSVCNRKLSTLEKKVDTWQSQVHNFTNMEKKLDALQSQIHNFSIMEKKLDALQSQIHNFSIMEKKFDALQSQVQKHAAFTVQMDGSWDPLNIGESNAIRFPHVVTNIGHGYDPLTGYFTAPYSGTYVFYFHMRSTNTYSWLLVSIYKEKEQLLSATADGSGNHWNRGNVLVTTHLNAGQRVYCRHTGGSTWLEGGGLTNFSGFLVQAD